MRKWLPALVVEVALFVLVLLLLDFFPILAFYFLLTGVAVLFVTALLLMRPLARLTSRLPRAARKRGRLGEEAGAVGAAGAPSISAVPAAPHTPDAAEPEVAPRESRALRATDALCVPLPASSGSAGNPAVAVWESVDLAEFLIQAQRIEELAVESLNIETLCAEAEDEETICEQAYTTPSYDLFD